MGCSKQVVHLQEATLQVRPVCIQAYGQECEEAERSQPLLQRSSERNTGSFPQSPSLVLIPIIMSK